MNIAFFNHSLIIGSGIDTVIYELAKRIAKKHNVTVFTFDSSYSDENFKIEEIKIPLKNKVTTTALAPIFIRNVTKIRTILERFDVVNTHHYPANIISMNLKKPLNIVTDWGSVDSKLFTNIEEKMYVKFTTLMHKHAARHADYVITPCDFVKRRVDTEYGIKSTKLFLDGINFDIFNKNKIKCDSIYTKYPSLEDNKVILFVGRITPSKNIETLINAFKLINKKIPDTKLVIVGDQNRHVNYYKYISQLVKEGNLTESVIFTGVVSWEDLPKYYSLCDVYATCSLWEGFLRAEAYAMEKPIVAFDVAAMGETIIDGKSGLLVKEQTPTAFANALMTLLTNEKMREEMGKNGYIWAKENLDFDIITKNFINFIEEKIKMKST